MVLGLFVPTTEIMSMLLALCCSNGENEYGKCDADHGCLIGFACDNYIVTDAQTLG